MMKGAIIGTFKGKCCDSTVYNNNTMLLNRDLFNILINSEEYKRAMKNRYYIGFLGHPEDPNCMDFRNAAIVMTSMEMLDNGEIWGTFDLIDTPVGRIVKTFIDAGVTFGISIRGAGDVDGTGKVDPETFVFRGYDLVTFPAYDDAVPEFTAIAASTDAKKQSQFKKVCAAISTNLSKIQSSEALEIIQSQFAEGSKEYQQIGDRINELDQSCEIDAVMQQKVDAITALYLEAVKQNQILLEENNALKIQAIQSATETSRKLRSIERIMGAQVDTLEKTLAATENKYKTAVSANAKLKSQSQQYVRSCSDLENQLQSAQSELTNLRRENGRLEHAASSVKASSSKNIKDMEQQLKDTQSELEEVTASNLIYQREIESTTRQLTERDQTISGLKSKLSETVTANKKLSQSSSNRDEEVEQLRQQVLSCQQLVEDYQQAYADMCANAIGVSVDNIPITNATSPAELRQYIFGSSSVSGVPARPSYVQPEQLERVDDEYDESDGNLISL